MKKIIILLAATCLLLAGCLSAGTDPTDGPGVQATTTVPVPTTTAPAPTTTDPVPTTTDPVLTTEPTPTTTDSVSTTEPVNPEQEAIMELFNYLGSERNPYFWATGCEYATPQEVLLVAFFDGGFEGEHDMTPEENAELKEIAIWPEYVDNADFNRLPKDKMEAELQAVFGISLADLPDSAFDGLYYLECSNCYCFLQTGMKSAPMMGGFLDIVFNDDGTVSLTYNNYVADYVITLKPNGDSYLILSNVKAE